LTTELYTLSLHDALPISRKLLRKEPKEVGKAPAMIVFCGWQQINMLAEQAKKEGFKHAYPLTFNKKTSSQVLKANMKIVGATERKSTRLNSSHVSISYAVFCLKKKI